MSYGKGEEHTTGICTGFPVSVWKLFDKYYKFYSTNQLVKQILKQIKEYQES